MMREVISHEWFTVFIVLGLVAITLSKQLFSVRFNDFIGVLGNSKYLKIYSKDQKFIDGFDSLLFFNLVVSLSIFCFLAYFSLVIHLEFELFIFLIFVFVFEAVVLIIVLLERIIEI